MRPGAAELLADLERRLAVFAAHPTGETPITVNDETVLLLRRSDRVGLRELLRRERREYEAAFLAQADGRNNDQATEATVLEVHDCLMPVAERRLAGLLPLALHDPELLAVEMESLAAFRNRLPIRSGLVFWPRLLDWGAGWLGTIVGALAVEQGCFEALPAVFAPRTKSLYGSGTEPLVDSLHGEADHAIGVALMKRFVPSNQYRAPAWEARRRNLPGLALLRERYPELVSGDQQPLRSLVEFDFVQNIALGISGDGAVAHWTMYTEPAQAFAMRLHADPRLRERLASSLGLPLDEFDEKAPTVLEAARGLAGFPETGPIQALRTGGRY